MNNNSKMSNINAPRNLPIGLQDFKSMIEGRYIYVDKTPVIWNLVNKPKGVYFLSRPRRFGKSLLVSVLYYLFKGEKDLFKNLWIYDKWDFEKEKHPILRFDLSNIDTLSLDNIHESLLYAINQNAKTHDVEITQKTINTSFSELIQNVEQKYNKPVVILIDEYDKPILDHFLKDDVEKVREILRQFYGVLKSQDAYIRFLFMTGISKFSKLSVFSALNNLKDISLNNKYSTLLGLTQKEIEQNFESYLSEIASSRDLSKSELLKQIRYWYNGYSFNGSDFVYNPFSLLNFFDEKSFRNYWMESGSPSFLMNYIKKFKVNGTDLEAREISPNILSAYEIENAPPISFLIQSGYLTFKEKIEENFIIGFPNTEVKSSFNELILENQGVSLVEFPAYGRKIREGFSEGNFEKVFNALHNIFSAIPYTLFENTEKYYHAIILTTLWASGIKADAEDMANLGRSDIVVDYGNKIWVIEIKKDKTPEVALKQIEAKKYCNKYESKREKIYAVGLKVDSKDRNVHEFEVKTAQEILQ